MAAHRYWRIYITANDGGTTCAIAELGGAESLGGAPVLASGTASASSEAPIFQGGSGAAAYAFDGNASTSWNSGSAVFPQWLAYDLGLGVAKDIHQISITFTNNFWAHDPANAPAAFDVQFSDDGVIWTTYWSVDDTNYVMGFTSGETKSFSDLPGTARVSQLVAEPTRTNTALGARLTQVLAEAGRTKVDVSTRTSQIVAEAGRTNAALGARLTQIVLEVLRQDLEDIPPEPPEPPWPDWPPGIVPPLPRSLFEWRVKTQAEVVGAEADFISRVPDNEWIASCDVVIEVFYGVDPAASSIVTQDQYIRHTLVRRTVTGGVEGNIYLLTFNAITVSGYPVELHTILAISTTTRTG